MSSEAEGKEGNGGGDRTPVIVREEDASATPTLVTPVAVKISTPSTVLAETHSEPTPATAEGYFSARPAASELQRHPVMSSGNPSSPGYGPVDAATAAQLSAHDFAKLDAPARPSTHSTNSSLSIQSTDSSNTVTAASSAPNLTPLRDNRPPFPNQAYSALQSQQYPVPRAAPPSLKQRGTHPGQIFTFTSALASRHQPGLRTVNASAPVTPGVGLFNLQPPPSSSEWESVAAPGTYASPFLHFTQRAQPKETSVADVDVDPISGRKLINHYEIIDELGRGTHGKVKLGRDLTTDTHVAIKIVERFSKRRKLGKLGTTEDKVKKEVAILKQVRHPNVTALLEVIDDPTRKKVYIVLEWVELGQIQWRVKGPKEITVVEARRYAREKSNRASKQLDKEDAAIFQEAQRRLSRHKRRHWRTFRQIRQDAPSEIWSNELAGDDESGTSDDDKLSRISTESFNKLSPHHDGRRSSRTPSPLPPLSSEGSSSTPDASSRYLPLTTEPLTQSPITLTNLYTGLEGTMYGPYVSSIGSSGSEPLRKRALTSSESLSQMASEVLNSDLNDQLEYVPVLTVQQIRVAFRDTLIGLQYLHYQGIIHRDIKPPNLLETKEHRVKISDFGVSYLGRPKGENEALEDVSEHEAQEPDGAKELAKTVGTPAFYAPELCITEAIDDPPPITEAIDVWALGVTLFCMLFARTPFVDNEFVVMRQIVEDDVYIPKKRLKPVEGKARSRPSSQRRAYPPLNSERRHDLEMSYEDIDDDLYDLLKRMLVKDPRKRIKLEEVRHHPWIVVDIADKVKWLEETDPSRQSQGKKISVSKEDVNAAVVPLQFLDRVRTTIKSFGERLGFGSKPAQRGRTRSSVGGGIETSPAPSNASTTTHASKEGQIHQQTRGDEPIHSPLKAHTEWEHSAPKGLVPNSDPNSRALHVSTGSLSELHTNNEAITQLGQAERNSVNGPTSGSMRTVRQSDFHPTESPPMSPRMPETATALESPSGNGNVAVGGRVRRMFQSVRERSSARSSDSRAGSRDRASFGSIDTHGDPSLAISQATAAGRVNSPTVSGSFTPTSPASSARNSPSTSRPLSAVSSPSGDHLYPTAEPPTLSRTSSSRSISSLGRSILRNRNASRSPGRPQTTISPESSAEDWRRADNERIRKLIVEGQAERQTPTTFDERTCPPSPDDQRAEAPDSRRMSILDISQTDSSQEASPTGHASQLPAAMASSTSDFGSSASMSNPSIPSVISEASSMDLPEPVLPGELDKTPTDLLSSDDTVHPGSESERYDYEDGHNYHPTAAEGVPGVDDVQDDYDDSSDSDGGLVMRRKSTMKGPRVTGSHVHSLSTSSTSSRRSSSNNTMTKVSPRDSADEQQPQSMLPNNVDTAS